MQQHLLLDVEPLSSKNAGWVIPSGLDIQVQTKPIDLCIYRGGYYNPMKGYPSYPLSGLLIDDIKKIHI